MFIGSHHLIFETATRWKEIKKGSEVRGQSVVRGLALGEVVASKPDSKNGLAFWVSIKFSNSVE
jgi:hypothetical protein